MVSDVAILDQEDTYVLERMKQLVSNEEVASITAASQLLTLIKNMVCIFRTCGDPAALTYLTLRTSGKRQHSKGKDISVAGPSSNSYYPQDAERSAFARFRSS